MTSFFRKTGVKAIGAILCIISLTVSLISGAFIIMLLGAGAYDSGRSLYDNLAYRMMNDDSFDIMQGYFDPQDPTHPWQSYYDGGIYTGQNSNLLYTITDSDTGKPVLSTYHGEEARLSRTYSHSFSLKTTEDVSETYQVEDALFYCGNTYYGYDGDFFFNSLELSPGSLDSVEQLPSDVLSDGFSYNGDHYTYDGSSTFYRDEEWRNETTTWVNKDYDITCYLRKDLKYSDTYRNLYPLANTITDLRYWLIGILCASLVLGLALLVLLGCTVGWVNGKDEPILNPLYRIPADVALAICFFLCAAGLEMYLSFYDTDYLNAILALDALILLGLATLAVYVIVMLCARAKTHTLISGTLTYWCVTHLGKAGRWAGRNLKKALGYLPLVWKVLVCYCVLCLIEFFIVAWYMEIEQFLLWLPLKLVLGALVAYVTLCFRRLKSGAELIASGDYTTKIDETHLVMDFKDAADTLNHIQGGMNAAVDSRMKSERLKTELITNVSHDLKTPLTSIVSYVDLLKQEPAGSEAAKEYLEVLDRQSMRLKKLIEDLVEASKASTGNLNLQLEPLDFTMLLGQALGEYSQRLTAANLTPILNLPEEPVMVLADGRRLWRIFDNLLGNVVKYAMPGTRLYLTVVADGTVTATFRNISRNQLDVSAEELMERFVRGDASRHTEGSGLGLSIAKSLTESMGGYFALQVDGDLFKAMVTFPVLPPEPEVLPDAE